VELTSQEGRVLGCLVEKQLTTPQQYPLTDNALIAACNQTTSRDPVVAYDVSTVRIAARSLREKGLLRMVHRAGERSEKHQHLLDSALDLSPGQVSLLAVLLLRGPQTLAELRARSDRMHPFESHAQAQEALDGLTEREEPLVALLERQPGRKEARYGQLLVDARHSPAMPPSAHGAQPVQRAQPEQGAQPEPRGVPDGLTLAGLAREVELLRAEVAGLRAQIDGAGKATEDGACEVAERD
jgi:uncharacterized protein YceH (UPF0502 family)